MAESKPESSPDLLPICYKLTLSAEAQASDQTIKRIKDLNAVMEGFANFQGKMGSFAMDMDQLADEPVRVEIENIRLEDIRLLLIHNDDKKSADYLSDIKREELRGIVSGGEVENQQFVTKLIPFENEWQLAILTEKLRLIRHDVAGTFSIASYFRDDMMKARARRKDWLKEKFEEIGGYTRDSLGKLEGHYIKEIIELDDVYREVEQVITREGAGILYGIISGDPKENGSIEYSKIQLRAFLENVVRNTHRYVVPPEDKKKQIQITFKFPVVDGQKYIDMVILDNGITGFPEEIAERKSFVRGVSGGKGEGIMMEMTSRELTEEYEGYLIPENIVDDQGDVIGGQLTLRLPLK